jgi:hypothetical protein
LKVLIEEEFGDGIMSAIDFDLAMERQPDPKGDRVKISMSGKFLPYKYYGATGNVPTYGYKEEWGRSVARRRAVFIALVPAKAGTQAGFITASFPLSRERAVLPFTHRSPVLAAMAMEVAVGPAMALADRRSPERLAPNRPDDAAHDCAGRSGDQEAGAGARYRPNRVGLGRRHSDCPGKYCRRQ